MTAEAHMERVRERDDARAEVERLRALCVRQVEGNAGLLADLAASREECEGVKGERDVYREHDAHLSTMLTKAESDLARAMAVVEAARCVRVCAEHIDTGCGDCHDAADSLCPLIDALAALDAKGGG